MKPLIILCLLASPVPADDAAPAGRLRLRISWGHGSAEPRDFAVSLSPEGIDLGDAVPAGLEPGEGLDGGSWATRAGGGDVDALEVEARFPPLEVKETGKPQEIWARLLERTDRETAARLRRDPAFRPDPRRLSVRADRRGTRGFTVTVDQLLSAGALWLPSLDIFLAAGDPPPAFEARRRALAPREGSRVLDRLRSGPEASREEYAALWEDMGSPSYRNPAAVGPGHIVGLAWEGSVAKFGIDRGGNAWSDLGTPEKFRLLHEDGGLGKGLEEAWRGQHLEGGLPVITTVLEREGRRREIEGFAFPLDGPPSGRRGDIPMVLLERVRVSGGPPGRATARLTLEREPPEGAAIAARRAGGDTEILEETPTGRILLAVSGAGISIRSEILEGEKPRRVSIEVSGILREGAALEAVVKLPSPPVPAAGAGRLLALEYAATREATLRFWRGWLDRGALFEVPEERVNDLFRANLWHALRLPRRHGPAAPGVRVDLPYSNFAYGQEGTPWPVNQAVYVDSMLHDLRGYHGLSAEDLAAIYRNNQLPDGRVGGLASWGVYTPGMVHAAALHLLLSGDRASFDGLLPPTLRALDWMLGELRRAAGREGPGRGLVLAPLNDLSHEPRAWAFNQAYFHSGLDLLGRALETIGHPRAAECGEAAAALARAVEEGFGRASALSPPVELRDGTWIPYVPTDALARGRLVEVWYPTDVDTGALHLPRLGALDPRGFLATCLLEDHEDNLFLGGLGMANEPVYVQHGSVHLARDDAPAAIRAFYSMMACAFSHSALEPVEHRWGWGQYFGPPSTDGAWFELYRNLLVREADDGSLVLLGAAPRRWLEDGKGIRIERAPTRYGTLALRSMSRAGAGEIEVAFDLAPRGSPPPIIVRARHPRRLPIRSVAVDGEEWKDFDAAREEARIAGRPRGTVVFRY